MVNINFNNKMSFYYHWIRLVTIDWFITSELLGQYILLTISIIENICYWQYILLAISGINNIF